MRLRRWATMRRRTVRTNFNALENEKLLARKFSRTCEAVPEKSLTTQTKVTKLSRKTNLVKLTKLLYETLNIVNEK